ncbi:MFS transporter [Rhodobacterales bacterium HKCCE3408]|nr:MFS transporter [Rhodobacterales bacterium HKCCE3408]
MFEVIRNSWALLFGMMLLMVGNGLQGTLLGVRGDLEGFATTAISIVMSAYFAGFLFGSRAAPEMIRRVGHIRSFAALGSLISAALVLFPVVTEPWAWTLLRAIIGFCFSAVYVTAESWLNNAATNENRGQTLSIYMIVQLSGIVAAQGLLVLGDPGGYTLFIVLSVLVSLSFAPILLSVTPIPPFESTSSMGLLEIFRVSPLGCVGIFTIGGIYSVMFGMTGVYGTQAGLSLSQISLFAAIFYVGGMLLQFPIGWISDRVDRRLLILAVCIAGTVTGLLGAIFGSVYTLLIAAAFLYGGLANPLYALLVAYVNDFLKPEQMAAAGGRLLFINGVGAVMGPVLVGFALQAVGPPGFFLFLAALMAGLGVYAAYRMTVRPAPSATETESYAPILPNSTAVALGAAQDYYAEASGEDDDAA